MCGAAFLQGTTYQLTDEEMALIGPSAERELHYCARCLKASHNLQQGASLLSNFFERMLRASGIPGAKKAAETFKQKLLTAATRKMQ